MALAEVTVLTLMLPTTVMVTTLMVTTLMVTATKILSPPFLSTLNSKCLITMVIGITQRVVLMTTTTTMTHLTILKLFAKM